MSCSQARDSDGQEVPGDSDHEYLVPRPLSRDSGVTRPQSRDSGVMRPQSRDSDVTRPQSRDCDDIDRVMRQISLAVSRSRGVSSLSRAVLAPRLEAREAPALHTYTASLPRPKLKRLRSNEEKKQILRTKDSTQQKYNTMDKSRTLERSKAESGDRRVLGLRLQRTDSRSRVDLNMSQNNYYNLYGAPVTAGWGKPKI